MKTIKPSIFFCLFYLHIFLCGYGQKLYVEMPDSTEQEDIFIEKWNKRFESDLSVLEKKDAKKQKSYYAFRKESLEADIEENKLLFRSEEQAYLERILDKILTSNPEINSEDIEILLRKNASVNAVSVGQGSILIHVGLLRYLENESQLAFVISHELAHYTLNHSNEAIAAIVQKIHDKDFQKAYKAAARQEYMSYTKTLEFFKSTVFDMSRHSRWREFEADSLGLTYMLNAGYEPKEAISLLGILDQSDKPKYELEKELDLRKIFNHESYPFKDSWVQTSSLLSDVMKADALPYWELDSLKTHPDCPDRIEKILPRATMDYKDSQKIFQQTKSSFESLVLASDYESIRAYFDYGNIGRTLFEALIMVETHKNDPYLSIMVGKCFLGIHDASKNHEFSLVVESPGPKQSPIYRPLLEWIHRLRSRDYAPLGYYYLQKRWENLSQYPSYVFIQAQLAQRANLIDELKALQAYYREHFPEGPHSEEIKQLSN